MLLATGLGTLDYVMVGVYLLVTLVIVLWASRKQGDTEEFFLGGRRMPWMAVGLSMMATLLSANTYLGLPGEMIKNGVGMFAMYLAFPLSMLIVIPFFIPFFMRMRLTSAYEYLELRFDFRVRILGSALFFLLRLGWIGMVMYSGSVAMSEMTGWSLTSVILCLGAAATLYTFLGGLRAVIWTDVLQAVMLFGGVVVIVAYVWGETGAGPVEWWAEAHKLGHTKAPLFDIDPRVRLTMVTVLVHAFFWQICTHASDQVALQRYSATPSVAAARNSYIVNMVSSLAIGLLLGLAGLALLFFYTRRPELLQGGISPQVMGDKLMPYFYTHQLPLGFAGLILANFLCDAMQTLVSGVNSIAAVATKDLLHKLRPQEAKAGDSLWTARLLSVAIGIVCTLAALGFSQLAKGPAVVAGPAPAALKPAQAASASPPVPAGRNIYDLMPRAFNMFLGPLASLFLIGMFLPQARARTALAAALAGMTVSVFWNYVHEIFGVGYDLSPNWAIALPCVVSLAVGWILSLLENGGDHPGRAYTWQAIMRLPAAAEGAE